MSIPANTVAARAYSSLLSRQKTQPHLGLLGWSFVLLCLAILFSPLVVLVIFSFNSSGSIGLPFEQFTLHWFRSLLADPNAADALKNSLIVAAIVAPICVILGLTSAYATARLSGRLRSVSLGIFSIPLVVPWLVIGVAGLLFFNAVGVQGSLNSVVLMQVVVTFPLLTLILYARLVGMDPSVEEAGLDLGSSSLGVLVRLVLPQLATPILVGALFAFISSLGNFVVTFFVIGYDSTLPIWGYSELRHAENLPLINAASTLMVGITLILFLGVLILGRRDREGMSGWF